MENSRDKLNPKISVIIPTYNRADVIGRAIQSILNQTYQNFEIVIIDDSADNKTENVVKGFDEKRIKYIHNKVKTNLPTARNQGVRESSPDSKYIAFLDDDDEWLPRFLQRTVNILEKDTEIVMVTTYARLMTQKGELLREIRCEHREFWQQTIGSGCVIRKDIFTKKNLWYDERKVIEDVDFGLRVLKNHKWKCIPEVLRIYRPYPLPDSSSASSALPLREIELFYEKHFSTFAQIGKEALGEFHFKVGREFLKAGEIKKGRKNLLKALLTNPNFKYLLFYFISLFLPKSFQNIKVRILKEKIFRGKI